MGAAAAPLKTIDRTGPTGDVSATIRSVTLSTGQLILSLLGATGVGALITVLGSFIQSRFAARDLKTLKESDQEHDRMVREADQAQVLALRALDYELVGRRTRTDRLRTLLLPLMEGVIDLRRAVASAQARGRDLDLQGLDAAGRDAALKMEGVRAKLMLEDGCEDILRFFTGALSYLSFYGSELRYQRDMVEANHPAALEAVRFARTTKDDLLGQLDGLEEATRDLITRAESATPSALAR